MSRADNSDTFGTKDEYDKSHRSRNHIDILLQHTEAALVDEKNAHVTDSKFNSVQTVVQRKTFHTQEMNSELDKTFLCQS